MEVRKEDFIKRSVESWRNRDFMKPSEMEIRDSDFSQEAGFSDIVQAGSQQKQTLEGVKKQKVFSILPLLIPIQREDKLC